MYNKLFLPGESHGQRSLVGYSPRGRKESGMTEQPYFTLCTTKNICQNHMGTSYPVLLSHWWCSVTKSYLTLCDPKDCSTPGLPVLLYLPEFVQIHVHCVGHAIHPTISSSAVPFSSCFQSFPAPGSVPVSWVFTSGGQSIGVSA